MKCLEIVKAMSASDNIVNVLTGRIYSLRVSLLISCEQLSEWTKKVPSKT